MLALGAIDARTVRCSARRRSQKLVTGDSFDDEHGFRAERALDLSRGRELWWRSRGVEQQAATQQRSGPLAVREESEVTDADEAFW